jgi:hypothetical protein
LDVARNLIVREDGEDLNGEHQARRSAILILKAEGEGTGRTHAEANIHDRSWIEVGRPKARFLKGGDTCGVVSVNRTDFFGGWLA